MLAACDEVEGTAMSRLARHVRTSAHTQRSRRSSEVQKHARSSDRLRDERAREHAADEAKQAASETKVRLPPLPARFRRHSRGRALR